MLIFNTTYHLEKEISDDCLTFFKKEYIPKAIESGLISTPSISKVHANHGETGVTYALQFKVNSMEDIEKWILETGEGLQKELVNRYEGKLAGFVTMLEEVDLN